MRGAKVGLLHWPAEVSRTTLPQDLLTVSPERERLGALSDYAEGVRAGLAREGGDAVLATPWFILVANEMHMRRCAALAGMDAAAMARWVAYIGPPNRSTFEEIAEEIEAGAALVELLHQERKTVKVVTAAVVKDAVKRRATKRRSERIGGINSGQKRRAKSAAAAADAGKRVRTPEEAARLAENYMAYPSHSAGGPASYAAKMMGVSPQWAGQLLKRAGWSKESRKRT